jgi:nuclear pore complex protein Nup98-Nup96
LGTLGDPPGTANVTNFQPFVEKDNPTSSAQNSYQNILFQDPYKKWSAEELRLVDYAAGRRYGGAAGSNTFGVGSGFGSFGSGNQSTAPGFGSTTTTTTGGGLFGNNAAAGGAFGQSNTGTGGFGSNTGGGLFGNKPATTGGIFGASTSAQPAQPAQSGGLFGNSGTGGFGNTGTGSFGATNTGGGLFGNSGTQNKTGFGFGTTGTNTGGFGGNTNAFGNTTTNTGGGLFGNSSTTNATTGGGLFGNNNSQPTSGFGTGNSFGAAGQQQQQTGGLFNQSKPAGTGGLFGNTNTTTTTGGGLFGSTTNTPSVFGQSNNAQPAGGLFAPKPATGSTAGLFGSTGATQNANTGGGLFGGLGQNNSSQPQQTQQGGGIFGNLNQNQPQSSGFGTSTQSTGGSLFGTQNTQPQGSMFGSSTAQQPQNSTMGSSLFGNSQGGQSNAPSLTASINDPQAYGSLFANLGGNEVVNPGPLATPTNKRQSRRPSILPYYKLNPASASRFVTPQKRGYGLSYSTYGTPNSPSSAASTPGAMSQSLLLGGSLSRNLGKSVSTSNLRRSFNIEDSVLVPGAFSASSGPKMYHNGSVKKLVINKDLRSDLFSTPAKDKPNPETPNTARKLTKRVSFDTSNVGAIEDGNAINGSPSSTPSAEQLGYARPKNTNGVNGSKPDTSSSVPEMEEVKGNELAIVHEHEDASPAVRNAENAPRDGEPGEYWMSPTKEEIQNMNRVQRQKVADLTVGRENIGYVKFKVPVDLTSIDLDAVCGGIVVLTPRSATVYPNPTKKPPMGKGLNVPALIGLLSAWPRASRTGKSSSVTKHVERLKMIKDTKFEKYVPETGEWVFSVEHFTTYGLDDSEEEDDAESESSREALHRAETTSPINPDRDDSPSQNANRSSVPGAFEPDEYNYGSDESEMAEVDAPQPSFLGNRSAGSASRALVSLDQGATDDEYAMSEVNDDASDHLGHHLAVEHDEDSSVNGSQSDLALETPAGIMRARMRAIKSSATPVKVQVAAGDDWMDMLSKTISPQKRDRALLKTMHEADNYRSAKDSVREVSPTKKRIVSDGRGFATSIDLMNSLFEKAKVPPENFQASVRPQGVKVCF